jgi:hypothetical protein
VSRSNWLPFTYRGFYDIPRMLAIDVDNDLYLFDCPFDEATGEYSDTYTVYRLPAALRGRLSEASWVDLPEHGEQIGRVRTALVSFDPTRRKSVNTQVLDRVLRDQRSDSRD